VFLQHLLFNKNISPQNSPFSPPIIGFPGAISWSGISILFRGGREEKVKEDDNEDHYIKSKKLPIIILG